MLNNLAKVNEYIALGQQQELVDLCENAHKQQAEDIYRKIVEKDSHVVLVTGPSSSGKTTFSNEILRVVCAYILGVDHFCQSSQ